MPGWYEDGSEEEARCHQCEDMKRLAEQQKKEEASKLFDISHLGSSFIVRLRSTGEVLCFRPDEESANEAMRLIQSTGQYAKPENQGSYDSLARRHPNTGRSSTGS